MLLKKKYILYEFRLENKNFKKYIFKGYIMNIRVSPQKWHPKIHPRPLNVNNLQKKNRPAVIKLLKTKTYKKLKF
jgi:hypothetical protein